MQPGTPTTGTFPPAGGDCCRAAGRRFAGSPHWRGEGGSARWEIVVGPGGAASGSGAAVRWLVDAGGWVLYHVVPVVPFLRAQFTECNKCVNPEQSPIT